MTSRPQCRKHCKRCLNAATNTCFVAGGQSLMQAIKSRVISPKGLIDLQRVAELNGIEYNRGAVRIGSMTRYRDIATDERLDGAYQALRDAASHVGDRQVRNRGTIGGSLCWNYIAACMPPTCVGIGASLDLVSKGGKRSLLAEEFLQSPLETARRDDEIVVAITVPAPPKSCGSAYKKWGLVTDSLPVVGVCAFIAHQRRWSVPFSPSSGGRTGDRTAASKSWRECIDRDFRYRCFGDFRCCRSCGSIY